MKTPKIVVVVDGGIVQEVWSEDKIDVVLIDHDNLEEQGIERDERDAIEGEETCGKLAWPIRQTLDHATLQFK